MYRVLVDGGISTNTLFKSALEGMGLDDKDMTQKSTILVGFSGETQQTIGEIILPTYDKGINLQTKFNVLDCPSAYNIILGTPWIHKMKAIPSTNH